MQKDFNKHTIWCDGFKLSIAVRTCLFVVLCLSFNDRAGVSWVVCMWLCQDLLSFQDVLSSIAYGQHLASWAVKEVAKECFIAWYCYNSPPRTLVFQACRGFLKCVPSVLFALVCVVWEPYFLHHYRQRSWLLRVWKNPTVRQKWG